MVLAASVVKEGSSTDTVNCCVPGVIALLVAANVTETFALFVRYDAGMPDVFDVLSVDDPPMGLEIVYEKGSYA